MASRPTVLITGASGYLGRLATRAFAALGDRIGGVVALDVQPPDAPVPGVEHVVGDVTDPGLAGMMTARGVQVVVHLASIVRVPPGAPADLAWRVDVAGSRNVLESAAAAGVHQLVVTSSGAAYGYAPDNPRLIDETFPLRGHPRFAYARHKRLVEELLAEGRTRWPGLRQLVFRPGTILGETTRSPITDLFEKPVLLDVLGGDSRFVFVWDEDVVACLVHGVLEAREGIYNLAGDGTLSPRDIARRLGRIWLPLPAWTLRGALGGLKALGLTQYGPEQVDFLRYRPVLDNRRLKTGFGYRPRLDSAGAFDLWARARGLMP